MKKLILAATIAALMPALVTTASAHRLNAPDTAVPVKLDPHALFDQLQLLGR